ncbi:MAG: adenine phosphoribosyltransferase [Candidatus Firestonebacteria bacterium]
MSIADDVKAVIRDVPDFPKKGIMFKDITPLLEDGKLFKRGMKTILEHYNKKSIDKIVGMEARGFITAAVAAYEMEKPFIPIRKKGKLPYKTMRVEYSLEYGTDILEMHIDAIKPGDKVLILDDLLATGGTAKAVAQLIEQAKGVVVGMGFIIELEFLKGKDRLSKYDIFSLVKY